MERQRNPELQRVLAALNGFTPPPSNVGQDERSYNQQLPDSRLYSSSGIPGLGSLLPSALREPPVTPPTLHREQIPTQQQSTGQPPDHRSTSTAPDVPDPSTIITWPAALKHVTRHLVSNEQVALRIKHLISAQRKHERQWWAGREAILERQKGRSGASEQVSALLKSLGGKDMPVVSSDPTAEQAELERYDQKVYAGLMAMTADFDRQLRTIGVPFYAIRHDLVTLGNGQDKNGNTNGKIDKGELRELQKKMLQTLEDLFSD